jgi:hypothetical protein
MKFLDLLFHHAGQTHFASTGRLLGQYNPILFEDIQIHRQILENVAMNFRPVCELSKLFIEKKCRMNKKTCDVLTVVAAGI